MSKNARILLAVGIIFALTIVVAVAATLIADPCREDDPRPECVKPDEDPIGGYLYIGAIGVLLVGGLVYFVVWLRREARRQHGDS